MPYIYRHAIFQRILFTWLIELLDCYHQCLCFAVNYIWSYCLWIELNAYVSFSTQKYYHTQKFVNVCYFRPEWQTGLPNSTLSNVFSTLPGKILIKSWMAHLEGRRRENLLHGEIKSSTFEIPAFKQKIRFTHWDKKTWMTEKNHIWIGWWLWITELLRSRFIPTPKGNLEKM